MIKLIIPICFSLFLFHSLAIERPCQQLTLLENPSIDSLTDFGVGASVEVLNRDLRDSMYQSVIQFKLSTIQLSQQEANPQAISEWYQNVSNMKKLAFETLHKKAEVKNESELHRMSSLFIDGLIELWVSNAFSVTMHEAAHGATDLSQGYSGVHYGYDTRVEGQKLNIGQLFLKLISMPNSAYAARVGGPEPQFSGLKSDAEVLAAGMNQETDEAARISREAMRAGKFNALDAVAYQRFKGGLRTYTGKSKGDPMYESGDPIRYINNLQMQGVLDNQRTAQSYYEEIHKLSVLTTLLSGGMWNGVKAMGSYIAHGDLNAETIRYKFDNGASIAWPELSTYLNGTSVSVSSESSIQLPESKSGGLKSIDVRVEKTVMGGDPKIESTLSSSGLYMSRIVPEDVSEASVRLNFESQSGKAKAYIEGTANSRDDAYGARVGMAYQFNSGWFVTADGTYSQNTLQGKRENCRSRDEDGCQTILFGIGKKFH